MRTQVTQNSRLAHKSQSANGNIQSMKDRILKAFKQIKYGCKTEISSFLKVPEEQIHKRLSEMQKDGLIVKTPISKRSSKTGELQSVWALSNLKSIKFEI